MKIRSLLMLACALAIPFGWAMQSVGMTRSGGWVIAIGAGALIFLFLLPAMGERSRQPSNAPERRVHWRD